MDGFPVDMAVVAHISIGRARLLGWRPAHGVSLSLTSAEIFCRYCERKAISDAETIEVTDNPHELLIGS